MRLDFKIRHKNSHVKIQPLLTDVKCAYKVGNRHLGLLGFAKAARDALKVQLHRVLLFIFCQTQVTKTGCFQTVKKDTQSYLY